MNSGARLIGLGRIVLQLALLVVSAVVPAWAADSLKRVLHRKAMPVDDTNVMPCADMDVPVAGEGIQAVFPDSALGDSLDAAVQAQARKVGLGGKYLRLGVIDSHVHLDTLPHQSQATVVARRAGATALKPYVDFMPNLARRVTLEAHARGLRVLAHAAPYRARPSEIVDAGLNAIAHACLLMRKPEARVAEWGQSRAPPDRLVFRNGTISAWRG